MVSRAWWACLLLLIACSGQSRVLPGDHDAGAPAAGGSDPGGGTNAGGTSGTNVRGGAAGAPARGGQPSGGSSGTSAVGGVGGVAGNAPEGGRAGAAFGGRSGAGAGFGGAGGAGAGFGGTGGTPPAPDGGVVVAWAGDRWNVVTLARSVHALTLYDVSRTGEVLGVPRTTAVEPAWRDAHLEDAAFMSSSGEIGVLADRAFASIAPSLIGVGAEATDSRSIFVHRLESLSRRFALVSHGEADPAIITMPGFRGDAVGFFQYGVNELADTRYGHLAFATVGESDEAARLAFLFADPNSEGNEELRLGFFQESCVDCDRPEGLESVVTLESNGVPYGPAAGDSLPFDIARGGNRFALSYVDARRGLLYYVLLDEQGTVLGDFSDDSQLRFMSPLKGRETDFVQVSVGQAEFPNLERLELREIFSAQGGFGTFSLRGFGKFTGAHLAVGPDDMLGIALRAVPSVNPGKGENAWFAPGLYLFVLRNGVELFRTRLAD